VLALHHERCQADADAWGYKLTPETFVFHSEDDEERPWRPDSTSGRLRKLCAAVGVDHVTFRGLRHYVATIGLSERFDPVTVAGRLGHSRASTTTDIYARRVPARDMELAERLGQVIR
jgi:integrase